MSYIESIVLTYTFGPLTAGIEELNSHPLRIAYDVVLISSVVFY
jgi:hypothetical protein